MKKKLKFLEILLLVLSFGVLLFFDYRMALMFYANSLKIIGALVIILFFIWLIWKRERKIALDSFISLSALIVTVFFFILQNLQLIEDENEALLGTNKYNCSIAKDIKREIEESKKSKTLYLRIKNRYSTELYKTNIGYLLKQVGSKKNQIALKAISGMETANRFLDVSLANSSEFPKNLLNSVGQTKTNPTVYFEAYSNIGKIYDEKIEELLPDVQSGLREMDFALNGKVSDECSDR